MPNLALSWTISSDGLRYVFNLKPNVSWHDGRPFTAADVVFSADVFLRKTHPRVKFNLQAVETIRALNANTVEFVLKHSFAPFLGIFEVGSMPMIPRHVYEGTDFAANPANATPIGTGPFKFKEWVKGSHIQLVRNEKYHENDVPLADGVYFHVIPDAASRAAAFESGKIDVVPGGSVELFDIERLAKLPGAAVTTKGWEYFAPLSWLWINHRSAPMDNVKFRQAVMHAIDREAICNVAWFGYAKPATGPLNSKLRFHTSDVRKYARMTSTVMRDVSRLDFVKTARAKGLAPRRILFAHVLRNALLPIITIAGMQAGALIGGAVLIETAFAWPGVGRLMLEALLQRDYPVLLGVFLVTASMAVIFNLLTDWVYTIADPRIELK